MRQSIFRWLLLVILATVELACHAPARAQFRGRESAPPDRVPEALEKLFTEIDESSLTNSPEREFQVEKGELEKTKLFRADPKLLENKFTAQLLLFVASTDASTDALPRNVPNVLYDVRFHELSRAVHDLPHGVKRLIDGRNRITIFTAMDPSSVGNIMARSMQPIDTSEAIATLSGYLKMLSELCPKDQLPPQSALEFLTGADCDRDVQCFFSHFAEPAADNARRAWYVAVYAPTEELAEQRARAIVQLFDAGLCRPLQRDCLVEAKKSLESARMGFEEVARQTEAIKAKQELLDKPSEVTTDILTQLRAQKVMIGVELAGLEARIKACNRMLMPLQVDAKTEKVRESVSDMKVRAEVELVGTKEKLDRINALIAEGNDRRTLREETELLKGTRSELQREIDRQHLRRAEAYARLVSLYAPLEIKDNKITISPVEWTN